MLSRRLAESGHYPAIDVQQSASRVMHNVVSPGHFELARRFRSVQARYDQGRDLVQIGAYVSGSDPRMDKAIELNPGMASFLEQDMNTGASLRSSIDGMAGAIQQGAPA